MKPAPRCCLVAAFLCCISFSAPFAAAHEGEHHHHHADEASASSNPTVLTTRDQAKVIAPTVNEDAFQFIVYGDRTGGVPAGLKVLEQAVLDTNLLDPDLVMTVGDLIQGYNETDEWLAQANEYKAIMNRLKMPWFPVAGNHDIYWRGKTPAPAGHHESNYETHFGPLWYSFKHKNAGFIVLYSDEGDPATNLKAFNVGALQQMSKAQLEFLDKALNDLADQDHVFVFLHHPRWTGGGYTGTNWGEVHQRLKSAGNVSAVFAGHIHKMRYDGKKDGIEYYALATTGGHIPTDPPIKGAGHLHHFNVVTVRPERTTVSALPVGAVFDPKQFTPEFLSDIETVIRSRPKQQSPAITISADGSANAAVNLEFSNPSKHTIESTFFLSRESLEGGWLSTLDHQHVTLEPGKKQSIEFLIRRAALDELSNLYPKVSYVTRYQGEAAAVDLPERDLKLKLRPATVPQDHFQPSVNRSLVVKNDASAIRIDNEFVTLPDGPFTLECQVKLDDHQGYTAVVAKTESSEFALFSDEGRMEFSVHLGGAYATAAATEKLEIGEWAHVAGVYDGKSLNLYIDGKRVSSKPASGRRTRNDKPLFLGADPDRSGSPSRPFLGQLDEFRLSSSVRYKDDFVPSLRHKPDDSTVILQHFDASIGPFVINHDGVADNPSPAFGTLGTSSRLIPVR